MCSAKDCIKIYEWIYQRTLARNVPEMDACTCGRFDNSNDKNNLYVWNYGWLCMWVDGCMDGRREGWMDGWSDGLMNGWMDGSG